jgi:hypothetical protein
MATRGNAGSSDATQIQRTTPFIRLYALTPKSEHDDLNQVATAEFATAKFFDLSRGDL